MASNNQYPKRTQHESTGNRNLGRRADRGHEDEGRGGHHGYRHRPVMWGIVITLVIILTLGLGMGYKAYLSAKDTFTDTFQAGSTNKLRNVSSVIKNNKPFSILLLGTDTGALGRSDVGRTDTLIVATINPDTETAYLTSIPRDTRVTVKGDQQQYEKINAAYTIGGPSGAVDTVQNLLDIPIDFYAIINMGGLEKMVDAVGGVDVVPPLTFKYKQADVKKGVKIHLNGAAALSYSRMRYDDPKGDYGRQKRQRQVLQALIIKGVGIGSLPRYQTILKSLSNNLKTDLSFDDMMAVRAKYGDASHHVKSETLQGQDAMIDGQAFQVASQAELKKVSTHIRKTLNLSPSTKFTTDAGNATTDSTAVNSSTTQSQY